MKLTVVGRSGVDEVGVVELEELASFFLIDAQVLQREKTREESEENRNEELSEVCDGTAICVDDALAERCIELLAAQIPAVVELLRG